MKIAHIAAASAALMLVSYAIAQTKDQPCTGACPAVIVLPDGCGGGITVAPDPIHIAAGAKATIMWEILTPGWTFQSITITEAGGKALETRNVEAKGTKASLTMKTGPAIRKYDVRLSGPGGSTCSRDPTIVNH